MRLPKGSRASVVSSDAAGPGAGATKPGSADGTTFSFWSDAGVDGAGSGAGAASAFLESNEPT